MSNEQLHSTEMQYSESGKENYIYQDKEQAFPYLREQVGYNNSACT